MTPGLFSLVYRKKTELWTWSS